MKLSENKQTILSYVESRMTFIAPNLSIIVGASTAAKLMGMAGGLTNLTKMPSCNILLLGAHKKVLGGFSSTTAMPHAGAIFYSKLVQDCPSVSYLIKIFQKFILLFLIGSSSSCCTFSFL
jgi:U4/U6 small nuclear ribonucleoprotein PRP31